MLTKNAKNCIKLVCVGVTTVLTRMCTRNTQKQNQPPVAHDGHPLVAPVIDPDLLEHQQ